MTGSISNGTSRPPGIADDLALEVHLGARAGLALRRWMSSWTSASGSCTGRRPIFVQLVRKMSAKLGAMTARKPESSSAHGACSRLEPQPKLRPATRIGAPAYSGRSSGKPSSPRQSQNRNSPKPVRSMRFRNCLGMIWSVSTSARSSGRHDALDLS